MTWPATAALPQLLLVLVLLLLQAHSRPSHARHAIAQGAQQALLQVCLAPLAVEAQQRQHILQLIHLEVEQLAA